MKYFLVVGEASGDLHASNLMKGIMKADSDASFRFAGGDRMTEVFPGMFRDYKETSFMMLQAVIHLRKIMKHIRAIKEEMIRWKADVYILVDYPGVNLRLARFASDHGMQVFYYITPTVWAWKKSRVKILRNYTDRQFVIFPFEVEFLREHGINAEFAGNPLMDAVDAYRKKAISLKDFREREGLDERPIVALLMGSRRQEIAKLLPAMLNVADHFKEFQFVVAGASSVEIEFYREMIVDREVKLVYKRTYDLLTHAHTGIITSGTATLETALFNVPQVVVYRTNPMAYHIARQLVNVNFISQVNLIYGGPLVLEVLQRDLTERVINEMNKLLFEEEYRNKMMEGYREIENKLGSPGVSDRLGRRIVELLKK